MDISFDTLAQPLQVVLLEDASFGSDAPQGRRAPHRHDYHELIWTRRGEGEHSIDGEASAVRPGTLTLIGRGQVHVFERARRLSGAVVRFGPEMQPEGPGWLVGGLGSRSVPVPPSEVANLEAVIAMLAAESARPPDARGVGLERHLLSILLLWAERWYDATRTERRDPDDADVQLYRRFDQVLERDFARHHDAAHYADALAVGSAQLSRALSHVTGRTTKQLITDRVMLEAARLVRFSDLTIGEIAFRAGFEDQLYFSRAFKRHYGVAPSAYRG
jgi:AraC family transcriptional activator of pobA